MKFTKQLQEQVAHAIGEIEQQTDAEVVCVLATRSDDYYYIPALWAALIALFSPLLLAFTHYWGHLNTVLFWQFGVFIFVWFLCRWPPILSRIIPKNIRYWRASNMDQGVAENISDEQWQSIVSVFVQRIKNKQVHEGFQECIQACGKLLAEHYPVTSNKNELPNKLVVL